MNPNNNLFGEDIQTTILIIVAIVYVSIIYILFGLAITYQLDKYVFYYVGNEFTIEYVEQTPLYTLVSNMTITFCVISIIVYLVRNIVQIIPFPLNKYASFDYHEIREVYTGSLLIIIMIAFSQTLEKQYADIKYKLNGSNGIKMAKNSK